MKARKEETAEDGKEIRAIEEQNGNFAHFTIYPEAVGILMSSSLPIFFRKRENGKEKKFSFLACFSLFIAHKTLYSICRIFLICKTFQDVLS